MQDKKQQKQDGISGGGAPVKREYEPPTIVYEGELTTRAGSCLVEADRGCHVDDPAKLFGGS